MTAQPNTQNKLLKSVTLNVLTKVSAAHSVARDDRDPRSVYLNALTFYALSERAGAAIKALESETLECDRIGALCIDLAGIIIDAWEDAEASKHGLNAHTLARAYVYAAYPVSPEEQTPLIMRALTGIQAHLDALA